MNIIITMAGLGTRFRNAGYKLPKYMIEVKEKTLFAWSVGSLVSFIRSGARFIFVVRQEDQAGDFISRESKLLGIRDFQVVELDSLTDGQATTVLHAEQAVIDERQPIGIYNIDTFVEPAHLEVAETRGEGWVPCFPGLGDAWSFARADAEGRIHEVREKQRISPHATVGFYWFGSFALFRDAYFRYYSKPENLERGERYVAPLYNQLIADGSHVYLHVIPAAGVHPLGTPEEVHRFAHA